MQVTSMPVLPRIISSDSKLKELKKNVLGKFIHSINIYGALKIFQGVLWVLGKQQ